MLSLTRLPPRFCRTLDRWGPQLPAIWRTAGWKVESSWWRTKRWWSCSTVYGTWIAKYRHELDRIYTSLSLKHFFYYLTCSEGQKYKTNWLQVMEPLLPSAAGLPLVEAEGLGGLQVLPPHHHLKSRKTDCRTIPALQLALNKTLNQRLGRGFSDCTNYDGCHSMDLKTALKFSAHNPRSWLRSTALIFTCQQH